MEYDLTISTLISTLNYEKQRTVKKINNDSNKYPSDY